ncbi:MAG TPA: hypothetical protein VJR92_12970 [Gemmatimonadaceae bacterium]|nr:hypothetical protein [Gemmatimonadaceae bacterium]
MRTRFAFGLVAGAVVLAGVPTVSPDFAVHEWGTFTTVAGRDGRAVDWLPLGGRDDLPCFVEHVDDRAIGRIKGVSAEVLATIPDYATARSNLLGKVRMETPVLYFYSEHATRVDVRVGFPRGLMTEWYPKANVGQQMFTTASLRNDRGQTSIRWPSVAITPNTSPHFPTGTEPSHYYAARATDATPVSVGTQSEKFLFYRGVANFDVPLTTVLLGDESIRVTNIGEDALPVVIAFTNRGGKFGYRVERNVSREATIAAPVLNATSATLRRDLEAVLVEQGLFAKEAAAMVDTWRDTWFEEGTRVFYVFPRSSVDATLPLTITPAPARVARVFVGRMDVITPAMVREVDAAIRSGNEVALAKYGRLLGPITDRLMESADAATRERVVKITNAALARQIQSGTICP